METVSFWSAYDATIERLLEPLARRDGAPETEVAAAESRLGLRLPELLREYYLRTGRHGGINGGHQYLLPPDEILRRGDKILFYFEEQSLLRWAVDMHETTLEDPPVYGSAEGEEWSVFTERLSDFLYGMLLWQCAQGAMENTGIGIAPRARLERAAAALPGWERLVLFDQTVALMRDGALVLYSARDTNPSCQVHVGGRTWRDVEQVADLFRVQWGYLESDGTEDDDGFSLRELSEIVSRQEERARTPWGNGVCANCGAPKRIWADSARGVCSLCGHPLDP